MVQCRVATSKAYAVGAVGEDVHLRLNACFDQGFIEPQSLLDWDPLVVECMKLECPWRVLSDEQVWRIGGAQFGATVNHFERRAVAQVCWFAVEGSDPGVTEHQVVRPAGDAC